MAINPPVQIINPPHYCADHAVDLTRNNNCFTARDVHGNVMCEFTITATGFTATGFTATGVNRNPMVTQLTLRYEYRSRMWEVFEGTNAEVLRFRVKKSREKSDVFLAENNTNVPDYKIEGKNWYDNPCIIYRGSTSTSRSIAKKTNSNKMTVNRNVDHAFIVALVAVLEKNPR